jgi:nucleoside-diphosphate-sugar epimerase
LKGEGSRGARASSRHGEVFLITGATGFIGAHLAKRLVREGHAVRCLVRDGSDTSRIAGLDVELTPGDLRSAPSLAEATRDCRYVFHCAALVSDWATKQEIAETNVAGTRRLLAACAAAGVERVVHFSSTDVYGHPGGAAIDESFTTARFRNWYSQTKREAESEVGRAREAFTLDVVTLRPATVYGPGSTSVIGEIAQAIRAGTMLLIDHGRAIAGLCYVENLIDAAVLAGSRSAARGETFNVTDGLTTTWREFTAALAEGLGCPGVRWSISFPLASGIGLALEHGYRLLRLATGLTAPPLLSRQAVQVLGIDQDFSNRKLRTLLDWEPRMDYAAGLRATLDWLAQERGHQTRPERHSRVSS